MPSVTTDRRRGINSSAAIKVPCIAASTANLTLSGEQTVDAIALVTGDRCFAKDQTDATEIGIYRVDTSAWQREPDFDGSYDVVEGTMVPVSRGTANADTYWRITNTGDIVIGTTSLTVAQGLVNIGIAATVTTTDESADTTCFPTFVTGATGDLAQKTGSNFTFNSSTGELGVSILNPTGVLKQTKGADVVSATALPLLTDGNYVDVTGVVTITSFNSVAIGTVIRLHFDGALILTHHATNLILPGGENITTAANDEAVFVEYAGGNWRCINYQRYVPEGQVKFPSTQIPSADVNTLDDYEEGTFTATLTLGGGSATLDVDTLAYTKIGRVCHVQGEIRVGTPSTPSGAVVLNGLPFTSGTLTGNSDIFETPMRIISSVAVDGWGFARLVPGVTILALDDPTAFGAELQAATTMSFNFSYITA